jgi:hypothetical protein
MRSETETIGGSNGWVFTQTIKTRFGHVECEIAQSHRRAEMNCLSRLVLPTTDRTDRKMSR